jgi:N-sulfoglucosamine sulfohydrolase
MKSLWYFVLLLVSNLALAQKKQPNIVFCIADDWGKHAGVYGDKVVRTPTFDRLAREGVLFDNAFCGAASCTPSRATILTGRYPHQNEESGNLWSTLQTKLPNYTTILTQNGYQVGLQGKGWGPGDFKVGGYSNNPAGKNYKNFEDFLTQRTAGQPFCFWFGSSDPHRPYQKGTGKAAGLSAEAVKVPPYWPDNQEVREDILDYYFEVERFDREVGLIVKKLEEMGELDNTLIVMTSDNGMPFPRAKATVYDAGTNLPLMMYWKNQIKPQRTASFVSFIDLAPTFLEIAGVKVPDTMTGKSVWPLLNNQTKNHRNEVFVERERHANVRHGNLSFPVRAIRTKDYLYIQNLAPDRWPAGDPQLWHSVGAYGDVDDGHTKQEILKDSIQYKAFYEWCFGKRLSEELYDLKNDPSQIKNVAQSTKYSKIKNELSLKLSTWRTQTQDPRVANQAPFETYPYYGEGVKR